MYYKINGSVGFQGPPLVMSWLRLVVIKGQNIGGKIKFAIVDIRAALTKQKVPHVADFLEKEKIHELTVEEVDCTNCEEEN